MKDFGDETLKNEREIFYEMIIIKNENVVVEIGVVEEESFDVNEETERDDGKVGMGSEEFKDVFNYLKQFFHENLNLIVSFKVRKPYLRLLLRLILEASGK